jgi:ABC-type amino acid transport substrate-binding protein
VAISVSAQTTDLLSPQESLWFKSRNNTIVVYPSENSPPYSYKNSAGNPQGLAIDYLELIAKKIGANIQFLTPRSTSQVLDDVKSGKGDVIADITSDTNKEQYLIFTDNYLTSPAVIVVRKDYGEKSGLNLNDFNGKQVAVVVGSSLESYMRINYPKVVIDEVTDNEVALQQVVLGEVDAASMDVASLSYFLSKQVLNSVKIVGDTGFEFKPSFGMPKNLTVLQSILEKGLSQISTSDRITLNDKWIVVPTREMQDNSFLSQIQNSFNLGTLYILFGIGIVTFVLVKRKNNSINYLFSELIFFSS